MHFLNKQVWDLATAELTSSRQLFGMITGLRCLPEEQVLLLCICNCICKRICDFFKIVFVIVFVIVLVIVFVFVIQFLIVFVIVYVFPTTLWNDNWLALST